MRIKNLLPVLLLAIVFLVSVAFAQEDVIIEEVPIEEEVIEEEVPVEEEVIIEEEAVEEEVMPEEEIVPSSEGVPTGEEFIMDEEEMVEEEVVEEEVAEEIVEEPTTFAPGWTAKVYVNFGPIEPWGDPGTGAMFNMGMRVQGGAQLNIGNWVNLPVIFKPLTAEVMVGYGMFNIKEDFVGNYEEATTNVISVLALGRYDVTDLILNLIGFEYPALGIFGVAGFQYNTQSWDFPNWTREFDSASSFGLNLGLGVKYNLQSLVGKPVEIDLRFTQGVFIMGDVTDQDGNPFFADDDYKHTENGILIGIAYPF